MVAAAHGRPWSPWQRRVADVIGEQLPNGQYAHPIVVMLVPRQCGKTTLWFDLALGRVLTARDYRAAYSAQTGHVSTERFTERFDALPAKLSRLLKTRRSQGTERFTYRRTRSFLKAFPPKPGALRSSAFDLVVVDESQEHDAALGSALDQTIIPTFSTRPRRQLALVGTAGTANSTWFAGYRKMAQAGEPGFLLIEYGAPEEGWDIDDVDGYASWHPGLAEGLTDLEAMASARRSMRAATGSDESFIREYGNIWLAGAALSPIKDWRKALAPDSTRESPPPLHPAAIGYGFGVSLDRSEGAIAAAWREASGAIHVRVLEVRPGTDWLGRRVSELAGARRAPIAWDANGAAPDIGAVIERADKRRVEMSRTARPRAFPLGGPAYAAACVGFAAAANDGDLTHADQPPLNTAVAASSPRWIGNRWVWQLDGPISMASLEAATCAREALLKAPPPKGKPVLAGAS